MKLVKLHSKLGLPTRVAINVPAVCAQGHVNDDALQTTAAVELTIIEDGHQAG